MHVKLRPIEEAELGHFVRLLWDPDAPGEYQWFGYRMDTAREGTYRYAVARTETGYVQLAAAQYYPGYVEFVARDCVRELHDLNPERRAKHLIEMSLVAEAVFRAFRPVKMNYEALGNSVPPPLAPHSETRGRSAPWWPSVAR